MVIRNGKRWLEHLTPSEQAEALEAIAKLKAAQKRIKDHWRVIDQFKSVGVLRSKQAEEQAK